uniref:Glycosyltransferase n=1 Tax=Nemophila menziesii TaxID=79376 RepID=A0A387II18_NEMME|nr:glucosyltransferase 13 [Nemophila menziesii]
MANLKNHKNIKPESFRKEETAIIIVPFPAQGHLNQLLQLSCLISSYGLPVHYVGSETHNRQAKTRSNGLDPVELAKVHFHDLPTPDFHSPSPDPNSLDKFPAQLQPSWNATIFLREPVRDILLDLSSKSKRIVIIHDILTAAVVQDAASIPNAEAYILNCVSVFTLFFIRWESMGKPLLVDAEPPKGLPSVLECMTEDHMKFVASIVGYLNHQVGELHNTSRVLEGIYLDLLAKEEYGGKGKQFAIGPLLPVKKLSLNSQDKCLQWLDKQEPNSVIYVSFGSTTSMSDEEVKELAMGLEESKVKFIWVLRDADKGDIFDKEVRKIPLPEKFEERISEFGIIIRDWAPQPEILAHSSTGGFMSHCGWNSCIESISSGVPIAAWPMHSDQPCNALLITEILKTGLTVREWARREELLNASSIANTLKRLMASQEGEEIRKRAKELGDAVRKSTDEGGVSRLEMDSFIAHITR